ncbi:MAG TPA: c-type cytochrome [Terriglobales bacterium]|nr:c-type cytochrome [Terriglobales bacterium]
MKHTLKAIIVVFCFAIVFTTWSLADNGADLFKAKCAMCHGPDGKGQTAMGKTLNLRDLGSAEVQGQSDADLTGIITNGKGKMPKYDGKLTKEQIGDVLKYVRTLKH